MSDRIAARPLWTDAALEPPAAPPEVPPHADVLVIGAGYTGLSAARETAAAGRSTLVLEAGALGAGCSSRNGGQVAYSIKPSYLNLAAQHGAERALRICREGLEAVEYLRALAAREIDCSWRQDGCFYGAHTPRHFERMEREARTQEPGLEQRIVIVPRSRQHEEIASDFYHGGCVYPDDASVDPARLLAGLLGRARAAGAQVIEHCAALRIRRQAGEFDVVTARGTVRARQVLLATNGYSGPLSGWHRRRVIPIGSYQIATGPLGRERVRALIPRGRNIVDSRRVVVYFRPSADGERIVFGGRAALSEPDPLACVARLRRMLACILPELRNVEVTHAWVGWVAYTFDKLPHLGLHEGVHYCMGYCGQGVPMAPYFGMRIGQQMIGKSEGGTALDGLAFPSRPYHFGRPWFLAPSVLAYRVADRLGL